MTKKSKEKNVSSRTLDDISPADARSSTFWALSGPSASGVYVNEVMAQNIATVYACVALRAQAMASLAIGCYKKRPNGDKDLADQHPAHWIWNRSPDGYLAAFNCREAQEGHKLIRGDSYYEIVRNFRGQAVECHLLDPRRMSIILPPGRDVTNVVQSDPFAPIYSYNQLTGPDLKLDRSEVLHFANYSTDGLKGIPPLSLFREAMGLTIAADRYASEYFRKGGYPLGFLTKPNRISEEQRKNLQEEWAELHGGLSRAHNVGILSGGLDWKSIGFNNHDSQLLQVRQFQKYEMAMIFRVPPFLIGDVEQPLSSIEFILIQFVTFTLLPEMKRNENEMNMKMFTPKERFSYFLEYNSDALQRGDARSRAEAFQIQVRNGARLINEWRQAENLNSVPYGDIPLVMASQIDTLENVVNGTSSLTPSGKTSTGRDKTSQLKRQKQFDRLVTMYQNLSPEDKARLKDTILSLSLKEFPNAG